MVTIVRLYFELWTWLLPVWKLIWLTPGQKTFLSMCTNISTIHYFLFFFRKCNTAYNKRGKSISGKNFGKSSSIICRRTSYNILVITPSFCRIMSIRKGKYIWSVQFTLFTLYRHVVTNGKNDARTFNENSKLGLFSIRTCVHYYLWIKTMVTQVN